MTLTRYIQKGEEVSTLCSTMVPTQCVAEFVLMSHIVQKATGFWVVGGESRRLGKRARGKYMKSCHEYCKICKEG